MYEAKVICDSVNPVGCRLTTITLEYPRFLLAEMNTHRAFSRGAASSRAIPAAKMRERVEKDPAGPVWWGKNQPGMQAFEELDEDYKNLANDWWGIASGEALKGHRRLEEAGVHKQIANRILEPFMWVKQLVSATDWANFFHLRCHYAAQPEMIRIALLAAEAYFASEPNPIIGGRWHLPYISEDDRVGRPIWELKAISVGRCARVSTLTQDGQRDPSADIALHNRLLGAGENGEPVHASPFEHVAKALHDDWQVGNFSGWFQYRKELERETCYDFTREDLERRREQIIEKFGRVPGEA